MSSSQDKNAQESESAVNMANKKLQEVEHTLSNVKGQITKKQKEAKGEPSFS